MDMTENRNEGARLDGNAIAGEFQMLMGFDVTTLVVQCAHCHNDNLFARLLAYVRAPGIVLRCPGCGFTVIQYVKTPTSIILNVEGISDTLRSTVIHR